MGEYEITECKVLWFISLCTLKYILRSLKLRISFSVLVLFSFFFFRGEYEVAEGTSAAVFNAILDYYRTGVIHCKLFCEAKNINTKCYKTLYLWKD